MKTFSTIIEEKIKQTIILLDYIIWFLFDFTKFKKINKQNINKVLVIHLGAIGELIISTPCITALKNSFGCEIKYMVAKGKEQVLENNPHLSEILIFNKDINSNVKNLKEESFDLAVILSPGNYKISNMCKRSKINYIVGCFVGVRTIPALFFNKRVFPISKKHAVEKNLDIVAQVGACNDNPILEIYISKKENSKILKKIKDMNLNKYAVIHPGFGLIRENIHPSRMWPIERYGEVADYLVTKYGFDVILTCTKEEEYISKAIKNLTKNKENVMIFNNLNIRDFMGIIKYSELVIEPSTGAGHIASALGVPVIDLIGRGEPHEWKPWAKSKKYIYLFHNEVCVSCNKNYCRLKDNVCMKSIQSNEVKFAIDKLLEANMDRDYRFYSNKFDKNWENKTNENRKDNRKKEEINKSLYVNKDSINENCSI